jgi:hypothetical protein
MINLNELYVKHYCPLGCAPFMNFCRLPKEDAFILASEIAAKHPNDKTFSRFYDFESHYARRMDIEKLLHSTFMSLGGKPKEQHPIYFVLHKSKTLVDYMGESMLYEIKLADIPSNDISFTLDDSMVAYKRDGMFSMYTKETLQSHLANFNGTIDDYLLKLNEQYLCIEAQIWNDTILPLSI